MGYKFYLAIINKEKFKELINKDYLLTKEDIEDGVSQDYKKYIMIIGSCKMIFGLGKLYFEEINDIYNALYNTHEKIVAEKDNYELFIPSQRIFFELANIYIQKAKNYYKKLIVPFLSLEEKINIDFKNLDKEKEIDLYKCVKAIKNNYIRLEPFSENQKDLEISRDYELEAFNLMYYHKAFNPKKEVIICYAW